MLILSLVVATSLAHADDGDDEEPAPHRHGDRVLPSPGFGATGGSVMLGGGFSVERGAFSGDIGRSVSVTVAPDVEMFPARQLSIGVRGAYTSTTTDAGTGEHVFAALTATAWTVRNDTRPIVAPRLSAAIGLESLKATVGTVSNTYTAPSFDGRLGLTFWPDPAVGLTVDVDGRVTPFATTTGQANYTTWTLQFGVLGMFNPTSR